jgi:hypothetical protein
VAVQFDAVKEMTDSVSKVFQRRNWLLGAPVLAGIFIMYVVIIVVGLIVIGPQWFKTIASGGSQTPDVTPAFAVGFAIGMTVLVLFVLAVNMFTYAWTLGAAVGVWQGHDPAFDRGFNLAAVKLVRLVAYQILVGLIAIVSIITIVGPIVIGVLSIYGPAYIVLGNRSATAAIGDSFRLASENIAPTIVLVLGFVVAVIAAIIRWGSSDSFRASVCSSSSRSNGSSRRGWRSPSCASTSCSRSRPGNRPSRWSPRQGPRPSSSSTSRGCAW